MQETFIQLLKEARCRQYIKNFFIFIPAFFAGTLLKKEIFLFDLEVFVLFCILASGIYMLNDCYDLEADRKDPVRNRRPLAAGSLSFRTVLASGIVLIVLALGFSVFLSLPVFWIFCVYVLLNMIYTRYGKHVPPLDIFLIAACFLCRIFVGTVDFTISCSSWLIVIAVLLTLLLAAGKRMDYLPVYGYNRIYISVLLVLLSTAILICYIIYTMELKQQTPFCSEFSYLTFLPVLVGIFRYLQCIFVFRKICCPTELLLRDPMLKICVFLWGISSFIIIYFLKG